MGYSAKQYIFNMTGNSVWKFILLSDFSDKVMFSMSGYCWLVGSFNCGELVQFLDLVLHM